MRDLAGRKIRLVEVETPTPSPFGRSLLFRYVGAFMYEGDAPLAERRAQALALDSSLLAELLGQADLRELLDPAVVARDRARTAAADRRAGACRDAGGASPTCCAPSGRCPRRRSRSAAPSPARPRGWLAELAAPAAGDRGAGRAARPRWAAIEDAGRLRDALGVPLPPACRPRSPSRCPTRSVTWWPGTPAAHGPFTAADVARRYGLGRRGGHRRRCAGWPPRAGWPRASSCPAGAAPSGATPGCCGCCAAAAWPSCARRPSRCRRRRWRGSCPPGRTPASAAGRRPRAGRPGRRRPAPDAVYDAVEQLAGAAVPASALETLVLPGRVPGYSARPARRADRRRRGGLVRARAGCPAATAGWCSRPRDTAPLLLPAPGEITMTPLHEAVLAALDGGGGAVLPHARATGRRRLLPDDAQPGAA